MRKPHPSNSYPFGCRVERTLSDKTVCNICRTPILEPYRFVYTFSGRKWPVYGYYHIKCASKILANMSKEILKDNVRKSALYKEIQNWL